MALATSVALTIDARHTATHDFGSRVLPLLRQLSLAWASGTGADQADLVFGDQRSLATTNEALDLSGVLTDAFGASLLFARIKLLYVKHTGTTGTLTIGGAAANGWITWVSDPTDKVVLQPGGVLLLIAPAATAYAVTAGTADQLKIDASAAITYDIVLIGASA